MAHRFGPPNSWLKARLTEGTTYREIAERWNLEQGGQVTTTNAIKTLVSRQGLATRANRYRKWIPWHVRDKHLAHYHVKLLRLVARTESEPPRPISGPEQRMVDLWLKRMGTDKVVAYDPDTEEGFFVTPRLPADGNGWIREHLLCVDPSFDAAQARAARLR
jgi:hypothetical protein